MKLSELVLSQHATVVSIDTEDKKVIEYFKKFGIEENALVEIVHKGISAFGSIAVRINDQVIALGFKEANSVIVIP